MSANLSKLIFRRGESLYGANVDAENIGKPRQLVRISAISMDRSEPLWAASPDACQIVYKGPVPTTLKSNDEDQSPQAVYIAALPEVAGTKIKSRLLFCTADLRDAHGRKVTTFPAFARLPHQSKTYPLPDDETDSGWVIRSLRWSNQGDRLYVSLNWAMNTLGGYATCVVDARTGRVITDAAGNWYRLLQTSNIDESRDGLLVGCGLGRTHDEPNVCNACSRYEPLYVATRTRKTPISLLPGRFNSKNKPEYAFAECCAVAPAGKRVAFVSNNQLWFTSVNSSRYTRLLTPPNSELYLGDVAWLGEHALIYHQYKFTGPTGSGQRTGNLWYLPVTAGGHAAAKPKLFLSDVEEFALLSQ